LQQTAAWGATSPYFVAACVSFPRQTVCIGTGYRRHGQVPGMRTRA
jgi:hypothetical protein